MPRVEPTIPVFFGSCKVGYVAREFVAQAALRRLLDRQKTTGVIKHINRGDKWGKALVQLTAVLTATGDADGDDETHDAFI